jgi:hypothetical protein
VVSIPAERALEVAELAQRYARDDEAAAAELRKGLTFSAAMAKFERICKAAPGAPQGNAQGSGTVVATVASTIRVGPEPTSVCISG